MTPSSQGMEPPENPDGFRELRVVGVGGVAWDVGDLGVFGGRPGCWLLLF